MNGKHSVASLEQKVTVCAKWLLGRCARNTPSGASHPFQLRPAQSRLRSPWDESIGSDGRKRLWVLPLRAWEALMTRPAPRPPPAPPPAVDCLWHKGLAFGISGEKSSLFTVILRSPLHSPPSSRIRVFTGFYGSATSITGPAPHVLLHPSSHASGSARPAHGTEGVPRRPRFRNTSL